MSTMLYSTDSCFVRELLLAADCVGPIELAHQGRGMGTLLTWTGKAVITRLRPSSLGAFLSSQD